MDRRLWQCSKKFMSWVKICDINVEILYTKWTLAGIYGHGVSAAISSSILYTKFRPSILLQWTSLHGPLRWLHLPSWMTSLFGSSLVWLRGNWTRTLQPLSGPLRTETDTHRQQLVPEICFSSYMRPCDAFQELTFVWLMLPQLVSACLFDPELFPTSLKISRTTRGWVRPRCIQPTRVTRANDINSEIRRKRTLSPFTENTTGVSADAGQWCLMLVGKTCDTVRVLNQRRPPSAEGFNSI